MKWATKAAKPSRGLAVLEETGWLRHFPEIAALRGTQQDPAWHPEGDVFTHTQHCLDALATAPNWAAHGHSPLLMFAVLAHDFGKPATTVRAEKDGIMRWRSPGHAAASGPMQLPRSSSHCSTSGQAHCGPPPRKPGLLRRLHA